MEPTQENSAHPYSEAPFQSHSQTSFDAAKAIEPASGTLRAAVLFCILNSGEQGLTDEEIQNSLSMNPSTQRPRRVELVKAGLIRDSGQIRKTSSGRNAVVWVENS